MYPELSLVKVPEDDRWRDVTSGSVKSGASTGRRPQRDDHDDQDDREEPVTVEEMRQSVCPPHGTSAPPPLLLAGAVHSSSGRPAGARHTSDFPPDKRRFVTKLAVGFVTTSKIEDCCGCRWLQRTIKIRKWSGAQKFHSFSELL